VVLLLGLVLEELIQRVDINQHKQTFLVCIKLRMSVCVGLYPLSESVPPEPDPTEVPPHSSPSTIDLLHLYHIVHTDGTMW
jgi:hypothetical protein